MYSNSSNTPWLLIITSLLVCLCLCILCTQLSDKLIANLVILLSHCGNKRISWIQPSQLNPLLKRESLFDPMPRPKPLLQNLPKPLLGVMLIKVCFAEFINEWIPHLVLEDGKTRKYLHSATAKDMFRPMQNKFCFHELEVFWIAVFLIWSWGWVNLNCEFCNRCCPLLQTNCNWSMNGLYPVSGSVKYESVWLRQLTEAFETAE